ncbi:MAG: methionine--tRNA ligase subunit beta [Candidatus Omnitrophica bacterium]|nr:methionine--tRNA ligase subunit beta [Candidatus Omnitrophota bacterium]
MDPNISPALISLEEFKKIEIRVAEIISASAHPNADKLVLLKIRVGQAEKQIVAGIRAHYAPETLPGKKIVVINNLEPAVIRGEKSEGMLLAASDETMLTLVIPEKDIPSGAKVK